MAEIIGVRFKDVGKIYSFDPVGIALKAGDFVIVETARGVECGMVATGNHEVDDSELVNPLKPVLRKATEQDLEIVDKNCEKEKEAEHAGLKTPDGYTYCPSGTDYSVALNSVVHNFAFHMQV